MNSRSNVKVVALFLILAFAPFVPVIWGFSKIRSSIIVDRPIEWQEGVEQKVRFPELKPGAYEIRFESSDSKFDGKLLANWSIEGWASGQVEGEFQNRRSYEWPIVQALAKLKVIEDTSSAEMTLIFLNSNPKPQYIRLKLARDRDVLLQKSTDAFQIVLAISLALMLLLWKPMTRAQS